MAEPDYVEYISIKVNNVDIALSGSGRVSFQSPYNSVDIVAKPTNGEIVYYEVRVTKDGEDYDIGVGTRAWYATSLPGNANFSFSIPVNATIFSEGDGKYRVGLYAKSGVTGLWDVTYIFYTVDSEMFVPSGSDAMEVLTDRDAPTT